ncbi:MAG: phage integrase N-terminal SAM-like domain-containing protein [bacterium]|nr:phage integrase N-terminal SAM-like domain-containing protein [bacterium]
MAAPEQQIVLIETWLEHLTAQGRSPHTLKAYRRGWYRLAVGIRGTYGESCDPTRLIARDIRDWKSHQQSVEKAAPRTVNQRLVAVSSFYKAHG